MFKYCLYFLIGILTLKKLSIYGGIINRNDMNNFDPKIWSELTLFEHKSKNIAPELWKKSNDDDKITFPYRIGKDLQLDINYEPFKEVKDDSNIPTIWSFMNNDGNGERKQTNEEETNDPFAITKN
uniref:Uncharacterized protein n=1 Tax=Strongyloides papillosus TaxID=174720 RepID=A0A0N5C4D7_STREA